MGFDSLAPVTSFPVVFPLPNLIEGERRQPLRTVPTGLPLAPHLFSHTIRGFDSESGDFLFGETV